MSKWREEFGRNDVRVVSKWCKGSGRQKMDMFYENDVKGSVEFDVKNLIEMK